MAPLLLLLPVVQLLLAVADAVPDSCAKATCAGHEIHYPFRLDSSSMPDDCVYPVPGIGLICQDNSTLILPLESHRYTVLRINYKAHTILVSDADIGIGDEYAAAGCPRLHVNLTIDAFWLRLAPSDSNITFLYSCKRNVLGNVSPNGPCQPRLLRECQPRLLRETTKEQGGQEDRHRIFRVLQLSSFSSFFSSMYPLSSPLDSSRPF
jgi:hypothetical protein